MFVGLLGPFIWVGDDGTEIRIPARKERAVLAFLALRAGSIVSTGQLEAVIWGDEPPRTARETLKTYISHLRRLVTATRIETAPGGYRLAVSPRGSRRHLFRAAAADRDRGAGCPGPAPGGAS